MKNVCLAALASALDQRNVAQAKEIKNQMDDPLNQELIKCGLDSAVGHFVFICKI